MDVNKVIVKLDDIEIQKMFSKSVHDYLNYLRRMFRHVYITIILMLFNVISYGYIIKITGSGNNILFYSYVTILVIALLFAIRLHVKYNIDIAMLEAYESAPVENVKKDLSDYIKVFGDWDKVDLLRTVEYALRAGDSADFKVLNESYYLFMDDDKSYMIPFSESVIEFNHSILKVSTSINLVIDYEGVAVTTNEES